MLIEKVNPVGADKQIQHFQKMLHDKLIKAWGLTETPEQYKSYGRIYKNQREGGMFVPEWYAGHNNYDEIRFDDISAYSFFGVADKSVFDGQGHETDAWLIFRIDLIKVKQQITHRADEEVRTDVLNIIKSGTYGFTLISIETGVRAAFKEYTKWVDQTKYDDMHPWHTFRLNFKLLFDTKIC